MTALHVSGIASAVAYVLPAVVLMAALSGRRATDEMTDVRLGIWGSGDLHFISCIYSLTWLPRNSMNSLAVTISMLLLHRH